MKHVYLTLLALLFLSFNTPKLKVVDKGWYRVGYSEEWQQPVWVEYRVACTEGLFSRKGLDFYPEPGLKGSDAADYTDNEWDKGHMAPAADFACDSIALRTTFSYLNCALQQENLNRGVWRHLETRERELAKSEPVRVRIDVLFQGTANWLKTGARIPSGFRKLITHGKVKESYEFPNQKPTSSDPQAYRKNK